MCLQVRPRPQTHFLLYLEPRKHVWWLKMSFCPLGLTALPKSLNWIWGTLRGGGREGEWTEKSEKEMKERMEGTGTPSPETNVWDRPGIQRDQTTVESGLVTYYYHHHHHTAATALLTSAAEQGVGGGVGHRPPIRRLRAPCTLLPNSDSSVS